MHTFPRYFSVLYFHNIIWFILLYTSVILQKGQVNIPKCVFFITRYICCGSILIGLSVNLFLVMVMYDNEFETKENKI